MRRVTGSVPLILSILALMLLVTGCPKRPGMSQASAPAPSGAGSAAGAGGPLAAPTNAPSLGSSATPPRPSEFKAGTKITITGRPMKDGTPAATWEYAVRASDGKKFNPREGFAVK